MEMTITDHTYIEIKRWLYSRLKALERDYEEIKSPSYRAENTCWQLELNNLIAHIDHEWKRQNEPTEVYPTGNPHNTL